MILINHHHLYYFWVVAREGSIARACRRLYLAQPTISAQIIQLEKFLKKKLFVRERRALTLTEDGRLVMEYANLIFNYSQELLDALKDRPGKHAIRVQVGMTDQISRQAALSLLRKARAYSAEVQPMVSTGRTTALLQELRQHELDLVLTNRDVPLEDALEYVKAEAGRQDVHFVAAPKLAKRIKRFPQDLSDVPLLLPGRQTPIGAAAEDFLNQRQVIPAWVEEVKDVELLRLMALDGAGVAPLTSLSIGNDLKKGKLVRLNAQRTGISQTLWLVAKKRHRLNPVAEYLLKNFKI